MTPTSKLWVCLLAAALNSGCQRASTQEKNMSHDKPDTTGTSEGKATDRSKHPGTITFVKMYDGSSSTKPISEFADSFIFVRGVPVVREELYTWDAAGNPCPPVEYAKGRLLRYGPNKEVLASVVLGPKKGGHR
jgi:hypothetical protein